MARLTSHHRFLLGLHLAQGDALAATVLHPLRQAADRLTTMPGISKRSDMTTFPILGHLVSWASLCPRFDEIAGKRPSTRTRHATPC